MGQEEEIRISKHRGRKWQVIGNNQNRFTHFQNRINIKGESTMKAKKSFVSFVLAVLLICTMALPASAAKTDDQYFEYDGSSFHASASIYYNGFSNYLEMTYCNPLKEDSDYVLYTSAICTREALNGTPETVGTYYCTSGTPIVGLSKTFGFAIESVRTGFHINDSQIKAISLVYE